MISDHLHTGQTQSHKMNGYLMSGLRTRMRWIGDEIWGMRLPQTIARGRCLGILCPGLGNADAQSCTFLRTCSALVHVGRWLIR